MACAWRPANQRRRWWPWEKPLHSGLGVTPGQYASNAEGDDDGKNHRYAENHVFRWLLIKRVGVGKERGGGHTFGAREGQQWGQGPAAGKVLEGDDKPTLLREDQHYLHYITMCFNWVNKNNCITSSAYKH